MIETEQLATLIRQKREVLAALWQLTEKQKPLVEAGDLTRLLRLLGTKQILLTKLQELEKFLDPFRDQDPADRVWKSTEARDAARRMAEECEQLLSNIMRVEQECETDLVERRDEAAVRLQGVHTATHARSAYIDSSGPKSSKLDLSSES